MKLLNEPSSCSKIPFSLAAALYWTEVAEQVDPATAAVAQGYASGGLGQSAEKLEKLKIATANVCTLYPKQDGAGRQDGAPNDKEVGMNASARRIALAELFDQEGIQILGVQEARTRWRRRWWCREYWMVSSGATEAGNAGVATSCLYLSWQQDGSWH